MSDSKPSSFSGMFEAVLAKGTRLGPHPVGMFFTSQPVGSSHGVGTSPSAATHPAGEGRFMNVVDGPVIRRKGRRKAGKRLSVAKMIGSRPASRLAGFEKGK